MVILGTASCELNGPPPVCVESIQFENLEVDSKAYEDEVLSVLEKSKPQDFRYFFKTFFDENEDTFMKVNIRSEDHCFDANILVEKWDKLGGMKKVNGKSYPKELINLTWSIEKVKGGKKIIYKNMNTIID